MFKEYDHVKMPDGKKGIIVDFTHDENGKFAIVEDDERRPVNGHYIFPLYDCRLSDLEKID